MRNEWGYSNPQTHNGPPVRELMRNGRWLVPPDQRPKLAPPPREESRQEYGRIREYLLIGQRNR